jgi:hypothetical protein
MGESVIKYLMSIDIHLHGLNNSYLAMIVGIVQHVQWKWAQSGLVRLVRLARAPRTSPIVGDRWGSATWFSVVSHPASRRPASSTSNALCWSSPGGEDRLYAINLYNSHHI